MKNALLSVFFFILATAAAAQTTIVGGAGRCHTTGDPDNITELQNQSTAFGCMEATDVNTGTVYYYNPTKALGDRWDPYQPGESEIIQTDGAPVGTAPDGNVMVIDTANMAIYLVGNDGSYSLYLGGGGAGVVYTLQVVQDTIIVLYADGLEADRDTIHPPAYQNLTFASNGLNDFNTDPDSVDVELGGSLERHTTVTGLGIYDLFFTKVRDGAFSADSTLNLYGALEATFGGGIVEVGGDDISIRPEDSLRIGAPTETYHLPLARPSSSGLPAGDYLFVVQQNGDLGNTYGWIHIDSLGNISVADSTMAKNDLTMYEDQTLTMQEAAEWVIDASSHNGGFIFQFLTGTGSDNQGIFDKGDGIDFRGSSLTYTDFQPMVDMLDGILYFGNMSDTTWFRGEKYYFSPDSLNAALEAAPTWLVNITSQGEVQFLPVTGSLGPGKAMVYNGSQLEWGTVTGSTSSTAVTATITQAAHGFTLGDPVYHDGTEWATATTTDSTTAIGVVSGVADVDNFTVQFAGPMAWSSHGYTLGETYYLNTGGTYQLYSALANDEIAQEVFTVTDADTVVVGVRLAYVFNPPLVDVYDSASGNESLRAIDNLIFSNSTVTRSGTDVTVAIAGGGATPYFGAVSATATDTLVTISLADTTVWRYDFASGPSSTQINFSGATPGQTYTIHLINADTIFFDSTFFCYTLEYLDSTTVADQVLHLYADADTNLVEISAYPDSPGCSASWVGRPVESVVSYTYDSLYQTILTFAAGAGYTLPSGNDLKWQDTLMIDLRAAGVIDSLDAFYVLAGNADSLFKAINWVRTVDDPQNDVGSYGGTFTLDSTGITSNDVDGYFSTDMDEFTIIAAGDDLFMAGWIETNDGDNAKYQWGSEFNRYRAHSTVFFGQSASFVDPTESDNSATGFFGTVRYGNPKIFHYANGTLTASGTYTGTGLGTEYIPYVGAARRDGGTVNASDDTVSVFIVGVALSETKIDAIYNAVAKYMAHY